jgi:hypothetical protein
MTWAWPKFGRMLAMGETLAGCLTQPILLLGGTRLLKTPNLPAVISPNETPHLRRFHCMQYRSSSCRHSS